MTAQGLMDSIAGPIATFIVPLAIYLLGWSLFRDLRGR